MKLFTIIGSIITAKVPGLPAWARVAIILAALVAVTVLLLQPGCLFSSSLQPISGHLSVSTQPT